MTQIIATTAHSLGTRSGARSRTRSRTRSGTAARALAVAGLALAALTGCGDDGERAPEAISTTADRRPEGAEASPACVRAMRERLDAAPFTSEAGTAETLKECSGDSEEAIEAAAEKLLRDAFPTPTAS